MSLIKLGKRLVHGDRPRNKSAGSFSPHLSQDPDRGEENDPSTQQLRNDANSQAGASTAWATNYAAHRKHRKSSQQRSELPSNVRGPRPPPTSPVNIGETNTGNERSDRSGSKRHRTNTASSTASINYSDNTSHAGGQASKDVSTSNVKLQYSNQPRISIEQLISDLNKNNEPSKRPPGVKTPSSSMPSKHDGVASDKPPAVASYSKDLDSTAASKGTRTNDQIWEEEMGGSPTSETSPRRRGPATPMRRESASTRFEKGVVSIRDSRMQEGLSPPTNQRTFMDHVENRARVEQTVGNHQNQRIDEEKALPPSPPIKSYEVEEQSGSKEPASAELDTGERTEEADSQNSHSEESVYSESEISETIEESKSVRGENGESEPEIEPEIMMPFDERVLKWIEEDYPAIMRRNAESDILRASSILRPLLLGLNTSRHDFRNSFDSKKKELIEKEEAWKTEREELGNKYDTKLRKGRAHFHKKLQLAKDEHKEQEDLLRQQHTQLVEQMHREHGEELHSVKGEHAKALLTKDEEISNLNKTLEDADAKRTESFKSEKAEILNNHTQRIAILTQTHDNEKEEARQRHIKEVEELKQEIGANEALNRKIYKDWGDEQESWLHEKTELIATHNRDTDQIHGSWLDKETAWEDEKNELKRRHDTEKSEIIQNWSRARDFWENERTVLVQNHERDRSVLIENQRVERAQLYESWNDDRAKWNKEKEDLIRDHENEKNLQIQNHTKEKDNLLRIHTDEIVKLDNDYAAQKQTIVQGYEDQIFYKDQDLLKLRQDHKVEYDRLRTKHGNEKEILKSKLTLAEDEHRDRLKTMQNDHKAALKRMEDDVAKEIVKYQKDINNLEQHNATVKQKLTKDHEAEKSRLIQKHQDKVKELNDDHTANMEGVLDELQRSNKVLLARDDDPYLADIFKTIDLNREPDEHLKSRFMDFVQIINNLANIAWKEDQTAWPLEVLNDLSEKSNQRLVRKHILKDSIWGILHKTVFCSPFRVFGKEGIKLEKEWNDACGQDPQHDNGLYTWPTPGMETERWRYFTLKECRRVLRRPLPSAYDPRVQLKRGWVETLNTTSSEIKKTLEELVELKELHVEKVDEIVISLPGTKLVATEEKVAEAQTGSLDVTLVPSLGRYGDVKGMELDTFTIIGGCSGEGISLP